MDICAVRSVCRIAEYNNPQMERLFRLSLWLTAVFLPWYNTGLSVAQMLMGLSVLFPTGLRVRLERLINNPFALSWAGLYVLMLLSLLYSEDDTSGWRFLRTMIPLFSFPLALVMRGGLSHSEFRTTAMLFLASVAAVSVYDIVYLRDTSWPSDHRYISRTVSHLRLGYFITWGLVLCMDGWYRGWMRGALSFLWTVLALVMLAMLRSIGMLPFLLLAGILYLIHVYRRPRWLVMALLLAAAIFFFVGLETYRAVYYFTLKPSKERLDSVMTLRTPYEHWDDGHMLENGTPALVGIHEGSLSRAWQNRSTLPYDGPDKKGQALRTTLIRYLASRGFWIKDSAAVMQLSDADIRAVENGTTNFLMRGRLNLSGRLYEILWEIRQYNRDGNPQGRSLATRLELWKAGLSAVKKYVRRGAGIGDVRQVLSEELDLAHSSLVYTRSFGPHNQWLALALAGGLPLLLWAWLAFFLPLLAPGASGVRHKRLFGFFIILMIGCGFWEDIFETQASVTFFSFFYWTGLLSGHYREPHDRGKNAKGSLVEV